MIKTTFKTLGALLATLFDAPGLDRLGLAELVSEHERTLYRLDDHDVRHSSLADHLVLWGLPLAALLVGLITGLRFTSLDPMLNGIAIIAGGLFGFLAMIFGIQTLGRGSQSMSEPVRALVRETRANVSYAAAFALLFVFFLMIVGSVKSAAPPGGAEPRVSVWISAITIGALLHLAFVLLMVLNRVRLAFARLT